MRESSSLTIRPLDAADSLTELTGLLHRAYKRLLDMGLRYMATWQSEEDTRRRIQGCICLVAVVDERIVGTISYQRSSSWGGIQWYERSDVATMGQFAVEPEWQQRGIGSALMREVEGIAIREGATELALSTAEPATHLIEYYGKRGYRVVEWTDATQPNYRSVIMSKSLSL